jgi:hypothetical protein
LPGDVLDGGLAGGDGRKDGVVEGDLAQLLPQEEVGLAVEGSVLVQQLRRDVGFDGAIVGEALEVEGNSAAEEVGAGLVDAGVAGVEQRCFVVAAFVKSRLVKSCSDDLRRVAMRR